MKRTVLAYLVTAIVLSSSSVFATQPTEDVDRAPNTVTTAEGNRYLMAGIGSFIDDKEWSWGASHKDNVGGLRIDLTYRINEWQKDTDLWFRFQYLTYNLTGGTAGQLSMLPIITYPATRSAYPMYVGVGLGPGFFLKQISKAGYVALNYAALTGVRFPDLFGRSRGLYMEVGYQGLMNLLSVGQQQGAYVAIGGIFLF